MPCSFALLFLKKAIHVTEREGILANNILQQMLDGSIVESAITLITLAQIGLDWKCGGYCNVSNPQPVSISVSISGVLLYTSEWATRHILISISWERNGVTALYHQSGVCGTLKKLRLWLPHIEVIFKLRFGLLAISQHPLNASRIWIWRLLFSCYTSHFCIFAI